MTVLPIKDDLDKLKKNNIGQLLNLEEKEINKRKKDELLQQLIDEIGSNEVRIKDIYKKYAIEFSLSPNDVENILEITKTERLRWIKEEKLKVVCYESLKKYGKIIKYPKYDSYQIYRISKEKIEKWREKHKFDVSKKRKDATNKGMETRNRNIKLQKEFYEIEWKKMLADWYRIDSTLGVTMELAYWTMWVSRWAKESHIKSLSARTKKKEYEAEKVKFYQMKNEAIKRIIKSPFSTQSFYQPKNADKITHLQFCDDHYRFWVNIREFEYVSKWDFYNYHKNEIQKCNRCIVEVVKDYYSLFHVSVQHEELKDYRFSFHTPYPIGQKFFTDKKNLPKVVHEEQEGLFRFGRPLFKEERVIFSMKNTVKYFEEAITKFDLYF